MTDTINDVVINYKSVGFDQTNAELQGLGKSVDGVVVEFEGLNKSTISVQNQFSALEKRFQTTAGQAAQFADVQAKVNRAVAQNPALLQQGNDILDAARVKYGLVADAEGALSVAHDRVSQQSQALFHALRGSIEQIGSGVPVIQAFTQQFNHLAYATTGEGGLSGAFSGVVQILRSIISPTTVAVGGMVALGAAVAVAVSNYDKLQVSAQRAIGGAGQRTGTTIEDINKFAAQNSSSSGLSVKDARAFAESVTASGDIEISKLHNMNDAITGFARQTGVSLDQAGKAFEGFARDPVKGFDELSKVFGDVDPKFRNIAEQFVILGDHTSATNVLVDAFSDKLTRAAGNTTIWTKALDLLRTTSARATSSLQPTGIDTQIAETKAKLDAAIAEESEASQRLAPDDARLNVISNSVANLSARLVELQQAKEKAASDSLNASLEHTAALAENATRAILPQIDAISKYEEAINKLNAAIEAGKGDDNTGKALTVAEHLKQVAQDTLDASVRQADVVAQLREKYGGVSSETAIALSNMEAQLKVAQAVTGEQQIRAEEEAHINALILQGVDATEARKRADAEADIARAQATSNIERQTEGIKDQTTMIKAQQDGTEASTAASIAYKNAIASGADSTAAAADRSATLANYMAKAASSATVFANQMTVAGQAVQNAGAGLLQAGVPLYSGEVPTGNESDGTPGFTASFDVPQGTRYTAPSSIGSVSGGGGGGTSGGTGGSLFGSGFTYSGHGAYDLLTSGASIADANQAAAMQLQSSLGLQTTATNNLTTSTNSLNSTMQEALSPYYTQDPRTSHIGFRSQGMASGGYVDVPGSPSANDNMIATIPVASGERIYVDSMPSTRGGGWGGSSSITINVPVTIVGSAAEDKNAIGRTVYQAAQTAARQLQAAGR